MGRRTSADARRPKGCLGGAALSASQNLKALGAISHGDGVLETVEDVVGGVLQAGVGLVQLAGGLGGELTELVSVIYVREGTKDQI